MNLHTLSNYDMIITGKFTLQVLDSIVTKLNVALRNSETLTQVLNKVCTIQMTNIDIVFDFKIDTTVKTLFIWVR